MNKGEGGTVRHRKVFYIPGYDPFPPRRYRELFRKEGAVQANLSDYSLTTTGCPGDAVSFGWHAELQHDRQVSSADFSILVWSDLVRDSMKAGIPTTFWRMLQTIGVYVFSGAIFRLMRLRKGPVIAALYPIAMLLAQLAFALLCGWVIWTVFSNLWTGIGAFLGLMTTVWVLRWFRQQDRHFFAYYLMQDYAFSAQLKGGTPHNLDERIDLFAGHIADALRSDVDEVLVVGHSSGAHLAISALARLLRAGLVPANGPVLSLLTLGHVVPMVSFLPQARDLRTDLSDLSLSDQLTWVDVTAPGDGCCFALCDPVAVTGLQPDGKRWPLVLSAAFTQTLSPEKWKRLRWRFFRLHFQYLCAFDRPGDYDYFQITAGALTLGDRFSGRAPSKSRIERPLSKYTSVAA